MRDIFSFKPENTIALQAGCLLLGVAGPHKGKVIFLTDSYEGEHRHDDTVGFQINEPGPPLDTLLSTVFNPNTIVWYGGEIGLDTLHILHTVPELGGTLTGPVLWGGDYDKVIEGVNNRQITPDNSKLIVGYYAWPTKELQQLIDLGQYICMAGTAEEIFSFGAHDLFKRFISRTGVFGKLVLNSPRQPQLN